MVNTVKRIKHEVPPFFYALCGKSVWKPRPSTPILIHWRCEKFRVMIIRFVRNKTANGLIGTSDNYCLCPLTMLLELRDHIKCGVDRDFSQEDGSGEPCSWRCLCSFYCLPLRAVARTDRYVYLPILWCFFCYKEIYNQKSETFYWSMN